MVKREQSNLHYTMHKHLLRIFQSLLFSLLALLLFSAPLRAQDGKALFQSNCTSCHAIFTKNIGPALMGVSGRHSEEWLLKWVHNSQSLVKSGDADAVKLFNDNNHIPMPVQALKDDEIKAIIAYVSNAKPPVAAVTPVAAQNEEGGPVGLYLLIAAVVLAIIAATLRRVVLNLKRAVRRQQNIPEPAKKTRWQEFVYWTRNHKKLLAVIIIIFLIYSNVAGWNTLWNIHVTQGYQPDQPIAYSHELHAGKMQIACIYCHSGAEKGKTAGVPSANVCMNCHKAVRTGPTTGEAEIAKIYKALDYDPDKGTYGPNPKPIQWVRVHNLPDLVYFNHSQHVVVGKIACQTCHGPVQEMTVAKQYSHITMAWCIDCHKATQVQMAGNHYYDMYHEFLKTNKNLSDSAMTVESIGGTECARCHY